MFEAKSLVVDQTTLSDRGWFQSGGPWILFSASLVTICLLILFCLFLFIGYKGTIGFFPKKIYLWPTNSIVYSQLNSSSNSNIADEEKPSDWLYGQLYKKEYKQTVIPEKGYGKSAVEKAVLQYWLIRFTPQQLSFSSESQRRLNDLELTYPFSYFIFDKDKFTPQLAPSNVAQFQNALDERVYGTPLSIEIYHKNENSFEMYDLSGSSYREQKKIIEEQIGTNSRLFITDYSGKIYPLLLNQLKEVIFPNSMSTWDNIYYAMKQLSLFFTTSASTFEPNAGILHALLGTVLLVVLTVILVMPLGVIVGIYLHEYSKKGWVYSVLRITLANLAGIPSIIYGMLGLGFFIYIVGAQLDHFFYGDNLISPVFGRANLFWGAQIMALLTLPVVIIATEEGLSYIPERLREASVALGATKIETIWYVLLPESRAAILTGLSLAMARTIAEVAPLLLMGALSFSSTHLLENQFPYIHVTHQFQTLGYYIYALVEQHPYIESAEHLVYATALIMLLLMIGLNLIVMVMRHRMRHPTSV